MYSKRVPKSDPDASKTRAPTKTLKLLFRYAIYYVSATFGFSKNGLLGGSLECRNETQKQLPKKNHPKPNLGCSDGQFDVPGVIFWARLGVPFRREFLQGRVFACLGFLGRPKSVQGLRN